MLYIIYKVSCCRCLRYYCKVARLQGFDGVIDGCLTKSSLWLRKMSSAYKITLQSISELTKKNSTFAV